VVPNDLDDAIAAYGSDGSCWGEDLDCDAACDDGLEDLRPLEFHEDCYEDELENDCYVVMHGPELCEADNPLLELLTETADCDDVETTECAAEVIRECGPDLDIDLLNCG